jgi:hypothetical protein
MPLSAFAHPSTGRFRSRYRSVALAGLLLLAPISAAEAQFSRLFGWSMPAAEVYHIIAAQGFRVTAPVYRNGRVFVADVVDPRGVHQRLIIDAFNGEILQAYRSGPIRAPERTVRAEPLEHPGQSEAPVSRSRTKPSRTTVRRESLPPANAAPSGLGAPTPASEPSGETGKANNEPDAATTAASRPLAAPEPKPPGSKAPAVTPVAPLDDAAAAKKLSQPATDVPVAPLE